MNNAKHTPGPLEAFTQDSFCGWWSIRQAESAREVGSGDGGFIEADAKLYAAAPELLEALEECLAVVEGLEAKAAVWKPIADKARAAIAKATGESQ